MRRSSWACLGFLSACLCFAPSAFSRAEPRVSLLREGDALALPAPWDGVPARAGRIRSLAAAGDSNFAAVLSTKQFNGQSVIWGRTWTDSGEVAPILHVPFDYWLGAPGSSPHQAQTALEQTCGVSRNGVICYSTMTLSDTTQQAVLTGQSHLLDSLWRADGTFDYANHHLDGLVGLDGLKVQGQEGRFWRSLSKPGISSDGTLNWVGSTADSAEHLPTDVAVYSGMGSNIRRIIGTGDYVTNWGLRVFGAGFSHHAFSPDGQNLVLIAKLDGMAQAADQSILMIDTKSEDARPNIMLETGDIAEPSWWTWKEFTHIALSNPTTQLPNGTWFVAGELTDPAATQGRSRFGVAREGEHRSRLVLSDGQAVNRPLGRPEDERTLVGRPISLATNASGDWAVVWWTKPAHGTFQDSPRATLLVNGKVVLTFLDEFQSDVVAYDANGDPFLLTLWFRVKDIRPMVAVSDRRLDGRIDVYLPVVSRSVADVTQAPSDAEHLVCITHFVGSLTDCPADLDDGSSTGVRDGGVDINDLLYFLALYQQGDPGADLDDGSGSGAHDGGVDINDLLFFLAHYQAGC